MIGLGTGINTLAIIVGGILGLLCGKILTPRLKDAITSVNGIAVIFIGSGGAIAQMLTFSDGTFSTQKILLMTVSLVVGTIIGELINLEKLLEKAGEALKRESRSTKDPMFTEGFVTASCTVCIGAMAIVGALEDGLNGNITILVTKSILDFVIVMTMSSTFGKGCIFSAIPVFVIQAAFTLLAKAVKPVMTELALADISFVGSVLIFCVGLNLIREKKISVANMLPSLLLAFGFAFIPALN